MYSKFIPNIPENKIEVDNENYDKIYYDLLDEFNQITKSSDKCYVLTLSNRINIDFCPVNSGIFYPGKDHDYLIIKGRYLTKDKLNKIKQKYFPKETNDFEVVYEGGLTFKNMVIGRIIDKRN